MLVAASAILTGDRRGPPRGTLMMGRWLDHREVDRLSQKTRLSLSMQLIKDPQKTEDFRTAQHALSVNQPVFVRPLGPRAIAGYLLVKDLRNKPVLILKIDLPRAVYAQGKVTVLYLLLWILAAGIVLDGTMYVQLDRTVLSRLARLSFGVGEIGRLGQISARVHADGNDELTTLGKTINQTFDTLERAEESLRRTNSELEDRVRKRTAQLAASKEAAEAASRAKSEFMANVSHELHTPMNGILGMIEMALDTEMSPELKDYLQTARFSAGAMMNVISDILDFSRLDAQRVTLCFTEFSVVDCVTSALVTLREAAGQKGLSLESDVAMSVPQLLLGDPLRIGQILSNLVGNGIKFAGRGQIGVRVDKRSETNEQIELQFSRLRQRDRDST